MATRITLVKKFAAKGNANELFSNTYSLRGTTPADNAAWTALCDLLIAQEKTLYHSGVSVVKAYCYASDADDAATVFVYDKTAAPVAGTCPVTFQTECGAPADVVGWIRWKTPRLTTKGRPIYLRKFYHGVPVTMVQNAASDALTGTWVTRANAFRAKLTDGTLATDRTITGPGRIEDMVSSTAATIASTRQLKKGRRRPPA